MLVQNQFIHKDQADTFRDVLERENANGFDSTENKSDNKNNDAISHAILELVLSQGFGRYFQRHAGARECKMS